jgi:phosphatidate cytidylyltransferase
MILRTLTQRTTILRVLTAVLMIPAVVALVWFGPLPVLAAAAAAVAIVALSEFLDLGAHLGLRPFRKWTFVCAAGLFYAQYCAGLVETHALGWGESIVRDAAGGVLSIEAVLLIFIFGAAAIAMGTSRPLHDILPAISIGAAGLLFVALPFSYFVRMSEIAGVGRQLVLFTLCLIWAGDIFAYFIGRSLGSIPMARALSPKKTWEGALGNVVGSLLVAVFFSRWMQTDMLTMLVIAGLGNIAGQLGDLVESAYKRGAGVKDSSSLLPGHGGMLDRVDSLIFAAPVVWAAYAWFAMRNL